MAVLPSYSLARPGSTELTPMDPFLAAAWANLCFQIRSEAAGFAAACPQYADRPALRSIQGVIAMETFQLADGWVIRIQLGDAERYSYWTAERWWDDPEAGRRFDTKEEAEQYLEVHRPYLSTSREPTLSGG